jgi:hypothetical protein
LPITIPLVAYLIKVLYYQHIKIGELLAPPHNLFGRFCK